MLRRSLFLAIDPRPPGVICFQGQELEIGIEHKDGMEFSVTLRRVVFQAVAERGVFACEDIIALLRPAFLRRS
jgi:hypothetical protein